MILEEGTSLSYIIHEDAVKTGHQDSSGKLKHAWYVDGCVYCDSLKLLDNTKKMSPVMQLSTDEGKEGPQLFFIFTFDD